MRLVLPFHLVRVQAAKGALVAVPLLSAVHTVLVRVPPFVSEIRTKALTKPEWMTSVLLLGRRPGVHVAIELRFVAPMCRVSQAKGEFPDAVKVAPAWSDVVPQRGNPGAWRPALRRVPASPAPLRVGPAA